jgi:hypothetical protein
MVKIYVGLVKVQPAFVFWHIWQFIRYKDCTEYRGVDQNE